VIGDEFDINELFTVTDMLVTDYSSSIFEYALLRKPMILLIDDLDEYAKDPGLYVDYRTEMIGERANGPDEVASLILAEEFDLSAYDAFIERECQYADGSASKRFVEFLSE